MSTGADRFEELYERYCDRALSETERAEFEALMTDPEMRCHFVELTRLDTQLSDEARIAQLTPATLKKSRAVRKPQASPNFLGWSLAAVVVLGIALYLAFRSSPAQVVATVTQFQGQPAIQRGSEQLAASTGLKLLSGDIVITKSAELLTCQFFNDATRVDVLAESSLTFAISPETKRLELNSGTLSADVSPQPANSPILVKTRDAEARIVGTKFTVSVEKELTTLRVDEGHVRMKRLKDSAEVDVKTGSFAVSGLSTAPLAAVAIPAVTGFSLIDADNGKPLPAFTPIPPGIDIVVADLPTLHLLVAPIYSGTVSSIRYELEGKSIILSKPPFWGSAEHVRSVLKLDSKSNARYALKATPFSGPNGTGIAGATYTLNGNIIVKH